MRLVLLLHFGLTALFVGGAVFAVRAELYDLAIYSAFTATAWAVIGLIRTAIRGG